MRRRWTILPAALGAALLAPQLSAGPPANPAAGPPANPLAWSLPRTSGLVRVPELAAEVEIRRDERAVPVVLASSRVDAIRGLGFLHAQERFFQMDAMRRLAAGRLSEVVGVVGVAFDLSFRRYRFGAVADHVAATVPPRDQELLEAYAEGVNAGLADLAAPPPEYGLIGATPAPWAPRDSVLVVLSMFQMLQRGAAIERSLGVMEEALPAALVAFLFPERTRFDSPLLPADEAAPPPLAIPPPEVVDLRGRSAIGFEHALVGEAAVSVGSNNWAVAGARSVHGGALLANDPHLRLTAPGIWYRAELAWREQRTMGLTLPGSPGILFGSNGRLAWGFTNTEADFQDLVVIEVDPDDPDRYRTPDGFEPFGTVREEIVVRGREPRELVLRTTRWGVVTGRDFRGRPVVLKWTALDPNMVNMAILGMAEARTLEEGIAVVRSWYGPSQNVLIADAAGRIGWAVSGFFPRRRGFDGRTPRSWAESGVGWDGPAREELRPVLVDPPGGILYTANNRTVDVGWARRLGHAWDVGLRAHRIGVLLRRPGKLSERDLLEVQLDTRVEIFDFYRDLVLEVAGGEGGRTGPRHDEADSDPDAGRGPPIAAAARLVRGWNGRADADQTGLPILVAYRRALHAAVMDPLLAPCRALDRGFVFRSSRSEEPVRRILEERPAHLLPPGYADWTDVLRQVLVRVLAGVAARAPDFGLAIPWGEQNRSAIHHPLADAVPAFAPMLNMHEQPLSGHRYAIRVATTAYGATARMVVSPGREDTGILHTPAGQSGHPTSPHYRDGHETWVQGWPSAFRAGKSVSTFRLIP